MIPGAKNYENPEYFVNNIVPGKKGKIWLRSRVSGILLFDPVTEKFIQHFRQGQNGFSSHLFSMMAMDIDIA